MYEFEQTINEQQRKIEELKMKLQTYQQQVQLAPIVQPVTLQQVPNQQLQSQIQAMQHQIQQAQLNAIQSSNQALSITPVCPPMTTTTPIISQVDTTPVSTSTSSVKFDANTSVVNMDDIFGTGKN